MHRVTSSHRTEDLAALSPVNPPSAQPITWAEAEAFAVPASFSEMSARGRARDAVRERWLRPADLDRAIFGPPERIWVPLWRFEGTADGFHLGLSALRRRGGRTSVMPTGGFVHHDGSMLVLARSGCPYDPSANATIERADARPIAEVTIPEAERVVPDVPKERADEEARAKLRRLGEPRQALFASVEVRITASQLVWLPMWVVRYRYAGEATGGAESEYHAAVSARTGKVVSERHPPALASLASRLRRLVP